MALSDSEAGGKYSFTPHGRVRDQYSRSSSGTVGSLGSFSGPLQLLQPPLCPELSREEQDFQRTWRTRS